MTNSLTAVPDAAPLMGVGAEQEEAAEVYFPVVSLWALDQTRSWKAYRLLKKFRDNHGAPVGRYVLPVDRDSTFFGSGLDYLCQIATTVPKQSTGALAVGYVSDADRKAAVRVTRLRVVEPLDGFDPFDEDE